MPKNQNDDDAIIESAIFDLANQGIPTEVDPDMADKLGAFEEDALSEEDALASRFDVDENGIVINERSDTDSE